MADFGIFANMEDFAHDSVVPYGDSPLSKKQQVANMFDGIAHKYDFLNRFLSGGIDIVWRRKAIRELAVVKPKRILDVATGTADFALMAQGILSPDKIIGIDISEGMLALGRQKIKARGLSGSIDLLSGDSESIAFPDGSFDAVCVAFGVRNFQNLPKGLSEIHRVIRPGGKLVVLEFSKPSSPIVKTFYDIDMEKVAPGVGKFFSKDKKAYEYLNESVKAFPEGLSFLSVLQKAGFRETGQKPLTFGICTIYHGLK